MPAPDPATPAPEPSLKIDADAKPDDYVIRVEGELDLAGCPTLESALSDAERTHPDRILLDVDQLSAIDSRGLRTLMNASRRSASSGSRFQVTRGTGDVARMFELTMLDLTLPFTGKASPDGSGIAGESGGS
jgi:anti-anti-sigma factor